MKKAMKYGAIAAIVLASSFSMAGLPFANAATTSQSFKGTITMFAASYGPSPTVKSTEMMVVAKEFERLHPGVTIKFVQVPAASNYDTWVVTEASAGQLPDIAYEQYQNIGGTIPESIFYNLDPYLKQKDPFVKGKTWAQVLNPKIIAETEAPNGGTYLIHGDYVGQGMFYNKNDFAKAGIAKPPVTWGQFIQDSKKLQHVGITPVYVELSTANEGELTWFSRLIYTNIFHKQYHSLLYTGDSAMGTEDQVIAIKKGVFGPKNPRWMEFWKVMKNWAQYMEKDPTGVSGTGDLAFKAFATGKSAMYFGGSWTPSSLVAAHLPFKWASFPDPYPVVGNFAYATNFNSSAAVGSPDGNIEYGIATPQADHTMTPAKKAMAIKWLQFITTPKNDSTIVNKLGIFVPTVVGSKPLKSLYGLRKLADSSIQSNTGGIDLTNQELDSIFRAFQGYLLGEVSLKAFGQTAGQVMTQTANTLIAQNHWNLSKYGVK